MNKPVLMDSKMLSHFAKFLLVAVLMSFFSFANGESAQHDKKGPHGGKMLRQDSTTLELTIFERGVPPEFRAWVSQNGKRIEPDSLTVTLSRLDGEQNTYTFRPTDTFLRGQGVVKEPHSFDIKANLVIAGKSYQWRWSAHKGRVKISQDMADKAGIRVATASSGMIERHLQVYGQLVTPPNQKAQVQARFPGLVTEVNVNIGDKVQRGNILAKVESNDSMQTYSIRSPINGVIQQRFVNVGEYSAGNALFTVVDNDTLWVELKIFPAIRNEVKVGLPVHIETRNGNYNGKIAHILPPETAQPFVYARVVLPNSQGFSAPGELIRAQIDAEQIEVGLRVNHRALQPFRDKTVVFINVDDKYEIRPLKLGRSDGKYSEVLSGLNPGDRYVVDNSYLIKADIEKSGAAHSH